MIKRVCVYCGSRIGTDEAYRDAAISLGRLIAERGYELVYGAGSIGLMGVVANTVLEAGGRVIGVIPEHLARREITHDGLSELHVVKSMHERKMKMAELSDAFAALPGGFGTFEELFEVITWTQLGIHSKNTGLLNVKGYFDSIVDMIDRAIEDNFINESNRELFVVDDDAERLLDKLDVHPLPHVYTWISSISDT